MGNNIKATFVNNSPKTVRLAIFEVKKVNGEDTGTVVFAGAIPGVASKVIELDVTVQPWACINVKNYKIGDTIHADDHVNMLQMQVFDGSRFDVTER